MIEVEAAGLSDTGPNRSLNEDAIASLVPSDPIVRQRKGVLLVLADGVGGHQAGEVASATAVKTTVDEYFAPSNHSRVEPALHHAIQTANLHVHDLAQRHLDYRSMETTLIAVALAGTQAYIAHIGDSRLYLWRSGRLSQLTTDHSEVAELVRMKVISADRLRDHPNRNVLTRTLGHRLIVRPDFLRQPVQSGDQLVLCTDGLWSEIIEDEMAEILAECTPAEACQKMIDRAIARDCSDNVSVQVAKIQTVTPDSEADLARASWLSGIMQRIGRK